MAQYHDDCEDGGYTCDTCGRSWSPEIWGRRCPNGCEDRDDTPRPIPATRIQPYDTAPKDKGVARIQPYDTTPKDKGVARIKKAECSKDFADAVHFGMAMTKRDGTPPYP